AHAVRDCNDASSWLSEHIHDQSTLPVSRDEPRTVRIALIDFRDVSQKDWRCHTSGCDYQTAEIFHVQRLSRCHYQVLLVTLGHASDHLNLIRASQGVGNLSDAEMVALELFRVDFYSHLRNVAAKNLHSRHTFYARKLRLHLITRNCVEVRLCQLVT